MYNINIVSHYMKLLACKRFHLKGHTNPKDFVLVLTVFLKLVGVWFVNQWILSGKKKVQLIELGPGRGTLASDMLRVSN